MNLRSEAEFQAFANLVTASAVNKRLLMRILAHLENKDLSVIHDEVAALDADFRKTVVSELKELLRPAADEPIPEGSLPTGREEERRGHALPTDEKAGTTGEQDPEVPIGVDHETRGTDRKLTS
jgi:hypothetical protein